VKRERKEWEEHNMDHHELRRRFATLTTAHLADDAFVLRSRCAVRLRFCAL
jgi:hypothetical protein